MEIFIIPFVLWYTIISKICISLIFSKKITCSVITSTNSKSKIDYYRKVITK